MAAGNERKWHPVLLIQRIGEEPRDIPLSPLLYVLASPVIVASLIAWGGGGNSLAILGLDAVFLAAMAASPLFMAEGIVERFDNWWATGSLVRRQRWVAILLRRSNRFATVLTIFVLPPVMLFAFLGFVLSGWHVFAFAFGYALAALLFIGLPLVMLDFWFSREAAKRRGREEDSEAPITLKMALEGAQNTPGLPAVAWGLLVVGVVLQILATAH